MNGLKISFAVVAFVLIQGVAVIWYISKLDSKVQQLYTQFQEENKKEVIENQIKMKLGLEDVILSVDEVKNELKKIKKQMEKMTKKTNQLTNQIERFHKKQRKGESMIQQSE